MMVRILFFFFPQHGGKNHRLWSDGLVFNPMNTRNILVHYILVREISTINHRFQPQPCSATERKLKRGTHPVQADRDCVYVRGFLHMGMSQSMVNLW